MKDCTKNKVFQCPRVIQKHSPTIIYTHFYRYFSINMLNVQFDFLQESPIAQEGGSILQKLGHFPS